MARSSVVVSLTALVVLSLATSVHAQSQTLMTHHVREAVIDGRAQLLGRLSPTETLHFDIVLPVHNRSGVQSFLRELYDPASPFYHLFITPEEFIERFGPSEDEWDGLVAFAKANGFQIAGGSRDAMDLRLAGTVANIEKAFHVSMDTYQHPSEERTFYSPDREPTVDLPFQLWHISGLDNYSKPHPKYVRKSEIAKARGTSLKEVEPKATTGSGPGASFLGSDMRAAYYCNGTCGTGALTGSGQNIGLFEFYGYDIADLNTYYSNAGQTRTAAVTGISTDGASLSCISPSCDDSEQMIDMTQALGVAPGIANLYVYVGNTDTSIISAMTATKDAPLSSQESCSWGWSPVDLKTLDPYFEKMAMQGQNFLVASGDDSAWCLNVNDNCWAWPADDANIVSVGGTDLTTSIAGGPWQSETAWVYSGGGISPDKVPIPSWQQLSGVITAANEGSTTYRNGPDVAANADFTFYVCADQEPCTANDYGGTSFAAPIWAGYLALVNEQVKSDGNSPIGFLNPILYPNALTSNYAGMLHDITSGNCGTYAAGPGYDLCTGWGSPNGSGLINGLAEPTPNFFLSALPSNLVVMLGREGSSTITITPVNGFSGSVSFSASDLPNGVTATFDPSPATGSSTLTLTASGTATTGKETVMVTGTSGSLTETKMLTLTLTPQYGCHGEVCRLP